MGLVEKVKQIVGLVEAEGVGDLLAQVRVWIAYFGLDECLLPFKCG